MLYKTIHQRIQDGGIYLLNLLKYVQTIIKPMYYYYCMRETRHTVVLKKSNANIHFSFCDTDLLYVAR